MDGASPMPPETRRELERLRTRAYGPHADIGTDPAALRRLAVLEGWSAVALSVRPEGDGIPPGEAPRGGKNGREAQLTRRRWTEATVITATACAATIIAVAGSALLGDSPAAVLAVVSATPPQRQDLVDHLDLERFDMGGAQLEKYEGYAGLDIWTARAADGDMVCLLVRIDAGPLVGAACAPPPLRPIVEVRGVVDSASGGVLRLTQNADVVIAQVVAESASD